MQPDPWEDDATNLLDLVLLVLVLMGDCVMSLVTGVQTLVRRLVKP